MMRLSLFLMFVAFGFAGLCQADTWVKIPNSHIALQLPNTYWHPSHESDSTRGIYFFKREPVTDSKGNPIIPAIMLFVENAKKYGRDIVTYSINKRAPFAKQGLSFDRTIFPGDTAYPVHFQNSLLLKCSYEQEGLAHTLYMIHIIDDHDEGIQLYLDMTTDIQGQVDKEFMAAIRSLKEE